MLEILNRYAHGLSSIPILHALRARGCLARMADTTPVSAEELAWEFSANRGYLDVALRMLVCMEWIRPVAEGRYEATAELANSSLIPDRIMNLYSFPFDLYVRGASEDSLEPWLERSEQRWKSQHPYLPDFLDGLLVIPLLLALRAQGRLSLAGEMLRLDVAPPIRRDIERLFVARGWAARSGEELRVNRAGRFVIDRIFITATVASYRPMFERAEQLLFGDVASVFARDEAGHETHVARTVNVIGSGFQHEKFFTALSDLTVACFDGDDYAAQPKYIVDMGCGDGTLLRRLYAAVRDRTPRGKVLDAYPLIPVAADFNEKALVEASRTLAGIEHIAVKGDVGDPAALLDTLRASGVDDLHRVLHVRSFLDHDRPYRQPEDHEAAARRSAAGGNVYIDAQGRPIPLRDMLQSTVEHLRRWSQVVNEHGLVLLEVHCLPPDVTARYRDESESFHFDVYHAFSHQFLLDPQNFFVCAAEAGLFCREGRGVGFPKHLPYKRITLNHFERRPYVVRRAVSQDLPALQELAEVYPQQCSRLEADESEFVLEIEGQVAASVRCDDQDGKIRLTSACVRPDAPISHLLDLLRFVEQYWAFTAAGRISGLDDCRAALPTTLAATNEEASLARAAARDVHACVGGYRFAAADDPRAAEGELGKFSFRWVVATLQHLGVLRAGETHELDEMMRRLGVAAKYHRYFEVLMRRLQDEGLVTVRGRRIETTPRIRDYGLTSLQAQVAEFKDSFQRRHPAHVALLNLTVRCLAHFEEIITGQIEITEVVFQSGDMDAFTQIFRGSAVSDFFNRIVADAVHAILRLKATERKIRILEIGAGTGATTSAILEVMQPFFGLVEFCFSDISLSFIRNARRRYAERYPSIDFRLLNIEEDFLEQGFEANSFDIIVAANVLHDTRDIEITLQNVRGLLKPGGVLVLNEYTSVKDCLFFSGALLHGYWLFEDPQRRLKDSCLLGVSQWMQALERSGFAVVGAHALPGQSLDAACSQSVMLCEALGTDVRKGLQSENVVEETNQGLEKTEIVAVVVEQEALTLLGQERASVYSAERPLMDMGFDSIELVELKSLLAERLGVKLSPRFLFEYETPRKMAAALAEMVPNQHLHALLRPEPDVAAGSRDSGTADKTAEVATSPEKESDAIAIVGVACRFPGGAVSAQSFWKILDGGRQAIVSMPPDRWRWPAFIEVDGKHKGIDRAGFLERIDEFDANFFRISPKEAELMDPQQRLLLELSWEALEDAGHRPSELSGRKVGVFVGVCHSDYRDVLATASDLAEPYVGTGSAHSLLSNRLSYFYDFKGPSLTVDTACSSSLFALHDAVAAIRSGDCEQALVGAANLLCSPTNSITYYLAGMLSPTGTCRTFDETANGYVRGEGAAMLLLKPLATALADGDSIYGLVKGTAVNHGGQAASLTAPKPEAQAAVIEAAWQAADITSVSVDYIEAHGTGTRLGDPVEIGGLTEAFRRLHLATGEAWPGTRQCGLGSVKTNIGHLEGAAGLAGLIKILMAMEHGSIPATLNFQRLNADIDLAGSPFYIVEGNQAWLPRRDERGRALPRRAGVSSFGFGGANAHAVIEDYPSSSRNGEAHTDQYLIPLSAKNNERLIEQARRLLEFVESGIRGSAFSIRRTWLMDVAYTLQVGRESMEERVAFVVQTWEELAAALRAYVAGNPTIPNGHRGNAKSRRVRGTASPGAKQTSIETSIAAKDLAKLSALWVEGAEFDWSRLYVTGRPRRIHLPTYAFARERYWLAAHSLPSAANVALLHPLVHENTSDFGEQRFSSTFTGQEFFLAGHQIGGQRLLPAVAYLEMAREAVARSTNQSLDDEKLEARSIVVRNVVWLRPLAVGREPVEVHVGLFPGDRGVIAFEVYSGPGRAADQKVIHCQGRAFLSDEPAPANLDIEELEVRMDRGRLEPGSVYAAFARMGLVYGPAQKGITAIRRGSGQLLAELRLPSTVQNTSADYVLHPSVMDSALQAAVGLIDDWSDHSTETRLPFALESLRVVSPCTQAMLAWVRFSSGSQPEDRVVKLDIDLCSERGDICVQMHGYSSRVPSKEIETTAARGSATGSLFATPIWQSSDSQISAPQSNIEYSERNLILCELPTVDSAKLEALVPHSQCLSLDARQQENIARRYSDHALACFERIQATLQRRPQGNVFVQILVPDHPEQALLAGLSGLLKTATLENPRFIGQLILVPLHTTAEELAKQLQAEQPSKAETLIRYDEQGSRHVSRWEVVPEDPEKPPIAFKDRGVYLITGGLGGLGVVFAREILQQTRESRVVLTGRTSLSAEKQHLLEGLSGEAGRVGYRQVDLCNLDQVTQFIAAVKEEYGRIAGVLHCAGVIADNFILKKDRFEFSEVLSPKVIGTYNLDHATQDVELDFFVLFSSIAGAMGNVGQADYAAANGFMDQFAAYRSRQVAAKQRHGRTRSINWPFWQDGGMHIAQASRQLLQQTIGMQPMQKATGLQAFYRTLALSYRQTLVIEGELAQIRRALLNGPEVVSQSQTEPSVAAARIDGETLAEQTQEFLRRQLSGVLKMPSNQIDPQAGLNDYGIDSILAMQLTSRLEETFGSLAKTLFFEYQTISELSEYFIGHHSERLTALFGGAANRTTEATAIAPLPLPSASTAAIANHRFIPARSSEPALPAEFEAIAIIGLSGRYPEAANIEAYWDNLRQGKDCIVEVPKERWDWRSHFSEDRNSSGRHYSKWGGFITGVDEFDPLFFNISPREADHMDPQERLFLQHAWMAIEDAGYSRASLQVPYERDLAGQVGVYVGVMWNEYQLFSAVPGVQSLKMAFAGNPASIANRVSYLLDLHGPSMTLDTMCSSSLTAIHVACQDLKLGRTSLAIAGGVNVSVHPQKYLMLSVGQFISSDGHCQSFGEGGDGYIPGEGVGVVVLKRLSDATRDGDHIYGIIRGSALNHGGKTNGYTVPNPQAQAGAISRALAESHTDARHISYLEAHGTGTRLGDPIEIAALKKAFDQYTQDTQFCLIGSAKSNIGHCESAAGIAGLTKVLLQMQHEQIVPSLHSAQLNPHIDFSKGPFVVNQALTPWEQPVIDGRTLPRIAGISSFGAGGSNAHMIVEEYRTAEPLPVAMSNVVILLSARTEEQLQHKAHDLLDFLRARQSVIDLVAMAYTLQAGRDAMEERLGFIVSSVEQLARKLEAYVAGERNIDDFYQGEVKRNKETLSLFSTDGDLQQTIDKWIANRKLSRLLDLWVKGLDLDWSRLYGESRPRRISLPTYPFAKERYWIDTAGRQNGSSSVATTAVIHPLLHRNTSDLSEQRYSSTFSGEEFFVTDHQVVTESETPQRVLPGVACLEMARAAIECALPEEPEPRVLELLNNVWAQPIVVTDKKVVSIALSPADDEHIDYEIYTQESGQRIIHCQGRAVLNGQSAPARLDLAAIKAQIGLDPLEPAALYAAYARMGLRYGTGFRGITAIHRGDDQLLVLLELPSTVKETSENYILHPSLIDGALQASLALIDGSFESAGRPRLPFALESLRIVSRCTPEMVAWIRYANSPAVDNLRRLDIDLCDERGTVCVQMHGFSSRELGPAAGSLLAAPVWQASIESVSEKNKLEFVEHHVILCEVPEVDVKTLPGQCLSLQAEQHKTIAQRYSDHALACFQRIRAVLRAGQSRAHGHVLVQIVIPDHQERTIFAGLSGLLKTAALENPQFIGQTILVPAEITGKQLARYLREEKAFAFDPLVKREPGRRHILRWQDVPPGSDKPSVVFKDQGIYLITGGLGGLGILFAKEILDKTRASRVVLAGRSALSAEKRTLLDGLSSEAGRVLYRQLDLTDMDQVKELIAAITAEYGQLNGILHSAGMIADNFILKKTSAEFGRVLEPKVAGTFNLDQASRDVELDFFVLFASIAGALGNAGQADYAAANGFMNQFAAYRNRQVAAKLRHGRTRSINWPLWQAGGMGIDGPAKELLKQTTGMQPMRTATGIEALYRALALAYDQLVVMEGDLTQMRRALAAGQPVAAESPRIQNAPPQAPTPATDGVGTGAGNLLEKTREYLQKQFADLLKLPARKIDFQAALEQYGIDSVLAMQLINRLEKTFGSLPKTLFFEYQNISDLAKYFVANFAGQLTALFATTANRTTEAMPSVAPSPASGKRKPISSPRFRSLRHALPHTASEADAIAIIGLSGRYPEAIDIDAYWRNLREGRDCVTEVPRERWDWREYFSDDRSKGGHHYSKWGGFISGVDEFDPLFFNISPKEAKFIDPQERLFLQHAWMAIEDAGYTRSRLQAPCAQDLEGQVGVYVGVMYSEYQLFGAESSLQGKRQGIAGSVASIANRVSYVLDLHGPSVTLDTMCSSSLTAIHFACQDLKLGRTSLAIAGGVNVSVHPNKYLVLSAGQFISSDGHCQSFGEGGDGYIPGEGVGVVVLKRLSEAKRDGDHIYGIVRGSALNHGGKTNGYTVPNPQAQASAISRALAEAHTDARHISYIEAHGTGTKLGDPIEIAALSKAFQQYTQNTEFCLIGSAKSNIGHCESAAGIAGLTKILLQMQHQQIVPSLHSAHLNPHIDFATSPFVVNQSLRTWEQPVIDGRLMPRIAGISSFGAGGSNAHMIIEEYQAPTQQPTAPTRVVIPLSARTPGQLKQRAHDLLDFVGAQLNRIDLPSIAYTLQTGREGMEERLGMVVSSVDELVEKLRGYVAGRTDIEDFWEGDVKSNKEALSLFSTDIVLQEAIDKWITNGSISRLLELWVKGLEFDWNKLYAEAKPQKISLPTYPFAKDRYWIDRSGAKPVATRGASIAFLHPLVHLNASDLSEQRYRSTFTGEEFFLAEYGGQTVLPAVVYLEMAHAAVQHASPARPGLTVLELVNTVWAQPFVVTESKPVSIAVLAAGADRIDYEIYSQDADLEIVHCQGSAVWTRRPAPARLDIEPLKENTESGQLVQLRMPSSIAETASDYVFHPSLMDGVMQAAAQFMDSRVQASRPPIPVALEALRSFSPCAADMVAWIRYAPGSQTADGAVKLDIDLCDERGHVCVQMQGVSWQRLADGVEPVLEQKEIATVSPELTGTSHAPVRREISFLRREQTALVSVERITPGAISLAAPSTLGSPEAAPSWKNGAPPTSAGRPSITLSSAIPGTPPAGAPATGMPFVRLYDDGDGIFSIEIGPSVDSTARTKDIIYQLLRALDKVQHQTSVKVLMIRGAEHCFVSGGRGDCNDAFDLKLYPALVSFPYPVIAALEGDTIGAGLLAAALSDFMVCNEDARYGYTDAERRLYPTAPEATLFSQRFGEVRAQDFLYVSTLSTGKQLRAKGWTFPIVPLAQVEVYARQLALNLATKSQAALRLLKQHLTRHLAGVVHQLTRVEVASHGAEYRPDPFASTIVSPGQHIHVDTSAAHVVVIKLDVASNEVEAKDLVAELRHIVAGIHRDPYYKAIVLASTHPEFLPTTERAISEDAILDMHSMLMDSELPVVAALTGNAKGSAWFITESCDASVYSRQGVYSAADIGGSSALGQMAVALFSRRFGNEAANEILLSGAEYSGLDFQQRVVTLTVAEHDDVLTTAMQVAGSWAKLPRATLAAWKRHAAATLRQKIPRLPSAVGSEQTQSVRPRDVDAFVATPIALQSRVVTASVHPGGIVVVKMEDREAKNMFSDALVEGLSEVFAHIQQAPSYKVVILTGFDSYFASGGTKESLLAIQEGRAKFTDVKIFQLPLDCRLPVIAAMQGHGIGAGWSMGMFSDIVLLSEESRYVSPYMNYGFTPGAGATWSVAEKIGQDLARETLLTAQHYSGRELKERGVTLRVLPRAAVYPAAMALAGQIAQRSRQRLINLKQWLTGHVRQALEETYRLELAMHDETFVGQSDTLAQIQNKFHQKIALVTASQPASIQLASTPVEDQPQRTVSSSIDSDVLHAVSATLKTLLANELQMRESEIDDNAQFVDVGLDSISGVTWIRKINEKYQTSIEATRIYSYPTLNQLSQYVKGEAEKHSTLPGPNAPPAVEIPMATAHRIQLPPALATQGEPERLTSRRSRTAARFIAGGQATPPSQPIAVIGMAGQFPQAENLERFWENIAGGRNCITEIPRRRWDVNSFYQPGEAVPNKTSGRWAGMIDEYDLFDPLFFNISPTEAESMDPQQRLFLQACWHSIENAGYDARRLSGSKCGVFVGCGSGDYHQLSRDHQLSAQGFTGNAMSILAARISYFLNLQGPCVSIDTACSSSLVSLAQACDSLVSGASDLALAGGVYVMVGPEMHIKTSQAGMLSPDGKCFTFDQRANGFVPGEGVGVVLLKRLADAERDGDIIHAVIQGWGVNQDGKTNGITAPNPESQTRLQREVYDNFHIDPSSIQLIEAHGTGTKLGDPIEVEGLKNAFAGYRTNKESCALGSVKSNIGHCLAAAGIAGVLKLILALKHRQLPPTINFEQLNEHIDLKDSPFYVNHRLREWESGATQGRRAATSSFGFSGTNAHMVIGEYLPPAKPQPPVSVVTQDTKIIIPLSARTAEQLEQKARDLLTLVRKDVQSLDLIAIAYTLQVGREAMDERLGILVGSVEQLAGKLEAFLNGEARIADLRRGQVKRSIESTSIISQDDDVKETIVDKWIANKKLSWLLDLWVNGLDLDWNKLYGEARPRRIALPVYPFAKERYWIEPAADGHVVAESATRAVLHPLLHSNTSDLSQQRYSSNFTGEEFFLTDHRVRTHGRTVQKVLPGVAYLEMVRAAIKEASPMQPESSILELHNTVWLNPLVVSSPKQVSISLSATDNDGIDYEIYSTDGEQKTVHCQGEAVFSRHSTPARLDIAQFKPQMRQQRLDAADFYAICAGMGLNYGAAHQGIAAIHLGENQLLAELRLPAVAETNHHEYVLHPSLMDSALQASIALIVDLQRVPTKPSVPFIVESLRIVSACTREMTAWVRYSKGSKPENRTIKVDIDLCDQQGNVCVQIRGFASRVLEGDANPIPQNGTKAGIHIKTSTAPEENFSFDNAFYQNLIADLVSHNVSIDEAVELG